MKGFFFQLRLFLKRLGFALLLLSFARLYFFVLNYDLFSATGWQIIGSFFYGIRFDYYSFVFVGGLFVVFSLFPLSWFHEKWYQIFLKILFLLTLTILLFFNFIDAEYFRFTGKRSSADFFAFVTESDDVWKLLPAFLKNYWRTLLVFILSVLTAVKYYPQKIQSEKSMVRFSAFGSLSFLLTMGVLFILARGFGYRPLAVIDAAVYEVKTMALTLNTPFTIMTTLGKENLQEVSYFSREKAARYYSPLHHYAYKKIRKKNVVIIILESFGREYVGFYNQGKGYTPFLDSLLQHSLTFQYSMANARCSIEGIPAVVASIPNLSRTPFITGPYASNRITALPSELKKIGYYSAFFHGGRNGTMGFDKFAHLAQYDDYFGMREYPDAEKDYDGHWGIYDEPYLQYFCKKMSSFKQPFFTTVFTLSSHHPFELPKKYKGKFKEGPLPIHRTVGYTDYALKRFFDSAKKTNWYKNTLFVLVADHTSLTCSAYYKTRLGKISILLSYFSPSDTSLCGYQPAITQQIDILPTVLDYLHYNKPFFAFGKSVFRDSGRHTAISYVSFLFQYLTPQHFVIFDGKKPTNLYFYKTDSLLRDNRVLQDTALNLDTLKAFIQTASEAMSHDRMQYETYEKKPVHTFHR